MAFENSCSFLSTQQKNFLIDGYCRQTKYNQQYIAIELCNIIIFYFQDVLICDFFIIFEKLNCDYYNELLCFDMKYQIKIVKNNLLWKYNLHTSYCLHETQDDFIVYRVGGQDNDKIPNIRYSIKTDNYNKLPLTQIPRLSPSTIFNVNYGLITIGGRNSSNFLVLSHVETLKDQAEWKYLSPMIEKRSSCSSVTISNKLFTFGGYNDEKDYLNSNEMLDFFDNNNDYNDKLNGCNKNYSCFYNNYHQSKWKHFSKMKHKKYGIGTKYFQIKNQIILIGGCNDDDSETASKSFSMFDLAKNKFIEYPNTLHEHECTPGIVIENNNVIYVIGNDGGYNNTWGVIENYDIRMNKWFKIGELNKILNIPNTELEKRRFQRVLHYV